MNKKNETLAKIGALKTEQAEITKQLVIWKTKLQKVEEFSQVFYETRIFTVDFWDQRIKEARERVKKGGEKEFWWLECETREKTEFSIYYQALDLFDKEIKKEIESRKKELDDRFWEIENEVEKLERYEARKALRKQGKEILPCEYKEMIGCLGKDQCQNCQTNYQTLKNNESEI